MISPSAPSLRPCAQSLAQPLGPFQGRLAEAGHDLPGTWRLGLETHSPAPSKPDPSYLRMRPGALATCPAPAPSLREPNPRNAQVPSPGPRRVPAPLPGWLRPEVPPGSSSSAPEDLLGLREPRLPGRAERRVGGRRLGWRSWRNAVPAPAAGTCRRSAPALPRAQTVVTLA